MKPNSIVLLLALLLIWAAPAPAFPQALPAGVVAIVQVNADPLGHKPASPPSAQFALHHVDAAVPDRRGPAVVIYATSGMVWEMLVDATRSITSDRDLHLIIEITPTDSIGGAHTMSRFEQPAPALFFALLSIPDVGRSVRTNVSPVLVREADVIHGPDLVPMPAPPLRSPAAAAARGPRK